MQSIMRTNKKEVTMLGVQGTGPWSEIRTLENQLRANKEHLANAPLSKKEKKDLEEWIEKDQERLKKLRTKAKKTKKK